MSKFKVGDRVVATDARRSIGSRYIGATGTVSEVPTPPNQESYRVTWDDGELAEEDLRGTWSAAALDLLPSLEAEIAELRSELDNLKRANAALQDDVTRAGRAMALQRRAFIYAKGMLDERELNMLDGYADALGEDN